MSTKSSQVVVAFDFSPAGQTALDRGVDLASRTPGYVLHVVCVLDENSPNRAVPSEGGVTYQYAASVQDAMTAQIEPRLRLAGATNRVHFFVHARIGTASEEIVQLAREVGADMIIVGARDLTGVERFVLGSVAEEVVRKAGCTVEVARIKAYPDVALLPIVEVPEDHRYVAPHRYFYEDSRVNLRPADWPLY